MERCGGECRRRAWLLLLSTLLTGACFRVGTEERRIIVLSEGTLEDRVRVARDCATEDQLAALRADVQRRFPDLPETDLGGLDLSWLRMATAQGEDVAVVVTFTPQRSESDAKAIADYAVEQARARLRARRESDGSPDLLD